MNATSAKRALLAEARALGEAARRAAQARFNIQRFTAEWDRALRSVAQ